MKPSVVGKITISPLYLGSCVSYELRGNLVVVCLFGLIPIRKIPIKDIRVLRMAARDEVSSLAFALNWVLFYCWRPAYRPIYLMKTAKGMCYLPRLNHQMHQRLLHAIKRSSPSARVFKKAA